MNETRKPKADRPETLREARRWGTTLNQYLAFGLCHRCAAQAAYGHQIGFTRVEHDPCPACVPVVASLPQESSHPAWRRFQHGESGRV